MLVALQILGIVSIFLLVVSNIEAHFEKKSEAEEIEYAKHVIEALYIANQ